MLFQKPRNILTQENIYIGDPVFLWLLADKLTGALVTWFSYEPSLP